MITELIVSSLVTAAAYGQKKSLNWIELMFIAFVSGFLLTYVGRYLLDLWFSL